MSSVRAKMRCIEVSEQAGITDQQPTGARVRLQAVYGTGQDGANAQWSKWTPPGELSLHITNPEAIHAFKVGRCYFVDMTEVTEDA